MDELIKASSQCESFIKMRLIAAGFDLEKDVIRINDLANNSIIFQQKKVIK
jgi:hypothetical protein